MWLQENPGSGQMQVREELVWVGNLADTLQHLSGRTLPPRRLQGAAALRFDIHLKSLPAGDGRFPEATQRCSRQRTTLDPLAQAAMLAQALCGTPDPIPPGLLQEGAPEHICL